MSLWNPRRDDTPVGALSEMTLDELVTAVKALGDVPIDDATREQMRPFETKVTPDVLAQWTD